MGATAASQPLGGAFEHDPLRRRYLAQHVDVGAGHDPGVQMRQQPGFAQHQPGHLGEVGKGGLVAEPVERLARCGIAQFRLVAQGEQSLMATGLGPGAGDRQHLLGAQVNRLSGAWRMGEGAVMTHVPAQLGQRDEDLGRIGYEPAMSGVAQCRGEHHQRPLVPTFGIGERQGGVSGKTPLRSGLFQNLVDRHSQNSPTGAPRSAAMAAT